MECKECEMGMKEHVRRCDTFYECEECAIGIVLHVTTCCTKPNLIYVNAPRTDGKPTKRKFCLNCGTKSNMVKMENPTECDALPKFDEKKSISLADTRFATKRLFFQYIEKKKIEKGLSDKQKWFREVHTPYLNSEDWKILRAKVLKRDNNTCQCCLEKPATQVHHKSYDYHTNEPAFNLVSVCTFCHEQITLMDRGEPCYSIHNRALINA